MYKVIINLILFYIYILVHDYIKTIKITKIIKFKNVRELCKLSSEKQEQTPMGLNRLIGVIKF